MDVLRPGKAGEEGAAGEALEIEREIGLWETGFAQPLLEPEEAAEAAELAAGEVQDVVEIGVALEERGPLGIDQPVELEIGARALERVDDGQGVDDVA
ncbi:MAG: hypothetical protein QM796_13480, partial [Chthoniobacteraceae bacterium]